MSLLKYHSDKLISNVLLLMNSVEFNRVVCCNIMVWEDENALKKFEMFACIKATFCEVKDYNRCISFSGIGNTSYFWRKENISAMILFLPG